MDIWGERCGMKVDLWGDGDKEKKLGRGAWGGGWKRVRKEPFPKMS